MYYHALHLLLSFQSVAVAGRNLDFLYTYPSATFVGVLAFEELCLPGAVVHDKLFKGT